MNKNEMLVLSWWDNDYAEEYQSTGYKGLEYHTKLTKEQLKPVIASLKQKGYLLYERTLVDDEGVPAGSGWSLTPKGRDAYWEQKTAHTDTPTLEDNKWAAEVDRVVTEVMQAYTAEYKFNDSPHAIQKRAEKKAHKAITQLLDRAIIDAQIGELQQLKKTCKDHIYVEQDGYIKDRIKELRTHKEGLK